ncbi:MAG: phasin family protein [Bradyrhizobium sp.]
MTDEAVERAAVAEARPAEPMPRVASFRERMASAMPSEDAASARAAAPAVAAPAAPSPAAIPATGIQAIANAYRDYTRKSLDDARSYAEQLSAVRSLDKAVEVQAKFAKKACETFAQDSRKIRELHRELFWQAFRLPVWPPGRTRPD